MFLLSDSENCLESHPAHPAKIPKPTVIHPDFLRLLAGSSRFHFIWKKCCCKCSTIWKLHCSEVIFDPLSPVFPKIHQGPSFFQKGTMQQRKQLGLPSITGANRANCYFFEEIQYIFHLHGEKKRNLWPDKRHQPTVEEGVCYENLGQWSNKTAQASYR